MLRINNQKRERERERASQSQFVGSTITSTSRSGGENENENGGSQVVQEPKKKKARKKGIPIRIPGQQEKEKARGQQEQEKGKTLKRGQPAQGQGQGQMKYKGPIESFFAPLLLSSPCDLYDAERDENKARRLWETICERADLAVPASPLRSSYSTAGEHFAPRAALVLEEARAAISRSLYLQWNKRQKQKQDGRTATVARTSTSSGPSTSTSMSMSMTPHQYRGEGQNGKGKGKGEGEGQGHHRITFRKNKPFTRDELNAVRPAGLFACMPPNSNSACALQKDVYLGVAFGGKYGSEQVQAEGGFALVFFGRLPLPDYKYKYQVMESKWTVTPLTTLVAQLRSFEAMAYGMGMGPGPRCVGFLPSLLGGKDGNVNGRKEKNGHQNVRFDNDDNDNNNNNNNNNNNERTEVCKKKSFLAPRVKKVKAPNKKQDVLPLKPCTLNPTQENAATSFLESPQNSITLVQGPPGTGKTTLLVSIICRRLTGTGPVPKTSGATIKELKGPHPVRVMVCAPTNKAISLIASRFLAISDRNSTSTTCNIVPILVGDADKLMAENNDTRESTGSMQHWNGGNELRSIFLFSWLDLVLEDYEKLKNHLLRGSGAVGRGARLIRIAAHLEKKLTNSLKDPTHESIVKTAARISLDIRQLRESGTSSPARDIIGKIDSLRHALSHIPPMTLRKQLLSSATVIFSTLASAGGQVFRGIPGIDDLIVDEASAASEPEICIPFHLSPNRLLLVGDPKQLPATVLSRRAAALGLAKSLQERLMKDCKFPYTMLGVQYRMNPAIASFPSSCFYGSKISNGKNVGESSTGPPLLLDGRPYTFIQVDGVEDQLSTGGSYQNLAEANIIVDLVRELQSKSNSSWWSSDRIRIITFYQAQVSLLKRRLKERLGQCGADRVVVATVDSSQGTESDIVIISFVRSRGNGDSVNAASAGFLTDDRRVNVALTRARHQLICVANITGMEFMRGASQTLRLLSANAVHRNVVVSSNFRSPMQMQLRKNGNPSLDLL